MITPNKLFSRRILEYSVSTNRRGMRSYINLDNAATTPPFLSVERTVSNFFRSYGSVHRGSGIKSQISTNAYDKAREEIKSFVNAPSDCYVILTGNTTAGMNVLAHFFSYLEGDIAVSKIEHSSSWLPWVVAEGTKALGAKQVKQEELRSINEQLQKYGLGKVLQYDVNDKFEFELDTIESLLQKNKIKAFVLTASSNLTGYNPQIEAIGRLAHKYGAYFIVDACQYIQHHPLDMQRMGIDFVAASGHKFYAPYGGGFLIGPKNFFDEFLPYQIGGGNLPYITQEGHFIRYLTEQAHDPGTPNAVGAVSMARALRELTELGLSNVELYETKLARLIYDELAKSPRVQLHVSRKHLSTVIPFSVTGLCYKQVAESLNADYGIGVRAGSFCVYDAVRKLLLIEDEQDIVNSVKRGDTSKIPGIIRASLSLCNTEQDAIAFLDAMNEITNQPALSKKAA